MKKINICPEFPMEYKVAWSTPASRYVTVFKGKTLGGKEIQAVWLLDDNNIIAVAGGGSDGAVNLLNPIRDFLFLNFLQILKEESAKEQIPSVGADAELV
jgi:hypothetical protein